MNARAGCGERTAASAVDRLPDIWAAQDPDRLALIEDHRAHSYGVLSAAVADTARRLVERGVGPGHRVVLVCDNTAAAIACYLGLVRIGAWPVILNAKLSPSEVDAIVDHCGAKCVIHACASKSGVRQVRDSDINEETGLGPITFSRWREDAVAEPPETDSSENVAALIYTTGTTGQPKGVMLSHANLMFVAQEAGAVRRLKESDRVYAVLPVSHILGLTGVVLSALSYGCAIRLSQRFDPRAVLSALANERVSVMIGTPSMYAMLAEYAARNRLLPIAATSLRLMTSAGAPLDPATKFAAENAFRTTLHNGYGLTETAPTLTLTRIEEPRQDCSVGCFLPGIEARLIGPDGCSIVDGSVGELHVRGPGVMKGYYRADDMTHAVIDAEGWFNTGDLATIENGYLTLVGRSKDMIVRFGFKIYPSEVEAVLNSHPGVARSAVVGRPGQGGEEIVAFVQPKETERPAADALLSYARERLASYKLPGEIVLMDQLPTSPAGKILKSALLAAR